MISDDDLIERIKKHYALSQDLTSEWREEAIKLYDMVAGHQWEEVDKLRMDEEMRPAVTFNLMAKYLDAVSGLQTANRQEITYYPRQVREDSGVNELLGGAVKWSRDQCDAEVEETDAFLDTTICGVGCVEHFIDTDTNPDGMIIWERRDPLEIFVDNMSRKRNYLDARWMIRIRMHNEDEFEEEWPGRLDDLVNVSMGLKIDNTQGTMQPHLATEAWKYENNAIGISSERLIPVFEYQWIEKKKYVKVTTPQGEREMESTKWSWFKKALESEGIKYSIKRYKKKTYYRAFIAGDIVLKKILSPTQTGFTYKFITGKRDRNKNTWIGIGRALKDPQNWVNKFFSDILFIIQTNAKGGIMAEEDAFVDPARAEEEYAKPNSITWMEEGAIQDGKIMPKPKADYPQGMDRLMDFAMRAMPETTGMNLEVMGMANKVQPGILEEHRKQAAMTLLQWAFDSMRQYYHSSGRIAAEYVKKYIADGRLIRLAGEQAREFIPLLREELNFEFDTIVDEAPFSTNQKEKVFKYILELLPYMERAGMPMPPEFFEYSPLPVEMVRKIMERMQPDPKQTQMDEAAQQIELAGEQKEVEKTESEIDKNKSVALMNQAKTQEIIGDSATNRRMKALEGDKTVSEIRKNHSDSEAQEIENEYFKRGRALPHGEA